MVETFGFTKNGISGTNIQNYLNATKGTPEFSGKVFKMSAEMAEWDATEKVKCALYDSSLNLLGETTERTDGGAGWFDFTFPTPIDVTADTLYYCCVISLNFVYVMRHTDDETGPPVTGGRYRELMPYAVLEDPIDAWDNTSTAYSLCIYATYTIAVPPVVGGDLQLKLGCGPGAGARIPHADMGIGLQRHPRSRVH